MTGTLREEDPQTSFPLISLHVITKGRLREYVCVIRFIESSERGITAESTGISRVKLKMQSCCLCHKKVTDW